MPSLYRRAGSEILVNTETLNGGADFGNALSIIARSAPGRSPHALPPTIVDARTTDVILNADRTRMYVARDDGFLSIYDTFTGQVIQNFDVGTKLGGMDLSADGSFLLVVEKTAISSGNNQNVFAVHRVDVATGVVTDFTRTFFSIEGPFHDVALFADGTAIVTTTLQGSGATTTYRLDTQTGVFTTLASPSAQAPIVTASADRLSILLTNGYNVSGPNQMYGLIGEGIVQQIASRGVASSGTSLHAFSPDGSLAAYVEPQTGNVDIFDSQLNKLTSIAASNVGGIAFDDHGDFLYLLNVSTREILKIDMSNWMTVANIPLPADLPLFSSLFPFGATLVVGTDAKFFTLISGDKLFRIENPTAVVPVEGSAAGETMTGTAAQDLLYALDGDDTLNGAGGNDTLRGGAGNDVLDGGTGHDAMYGGDGDDIYHVDDDRDRAAEATASGGSDEVYASVSFALEGNIERLILTGAAAIDGTGNTIANTITGNDAANTLAGMAGADLLIGNGGDDILKGGTGADELRGGTGNDNYFADAADTIVELEGEGNDIVSAAASYQLAEGLSVEMLVTTNQGSSQAINLTGNELANTINGNNGVNILRGEGGNDTLFGFGGNDSLDGGSGADTLSGGSGGDSYFVDVGDVVIETASQGYDIVYAAASYILGAGSAVEVLATIDNTATTAINLTGNELDNYLVGNAGVNTLDGGSGGSDQLWGREGDDSYFVDSNDAVVEYSGHGYDVVYARTNFFLGVGMAVEVLGTVNNLATTALNLTGNALDNYITGNAGANVLDGGGGSDVLWGREGDDSYFADGNDIVVEYAGQGYDLIYARADYTLGVGLSVEALGTVDNNATTAINLIGNELDNYITGNAGSNTINGGTGSDTLWGREGDDSYFVESNDVVIENDGQGYDIIYARGTFTLGVGVSVEVIGTENNFATTSIALTGNELANLVSGNAGANYLDGGAGADSLHGRGGADTFAFTTALGGGNIDAILDFGDGADRIALDDAVFTGLGLGTLSAAAFRTGTAAQDADDRIIYDSATGQLFYDADGNGAGAQVLFGLLSGAPPIVAGDFTVI